MADWMLEMQDATLINAISAAMPFGTLTLPALTIAAEGPGDVVTLTIDDAVLGGGMFVIDWGDGTPEESTSELGVMHTYEDPGDYDVVVRNWVGQTDTVNYDTEAP